MLAWFGSIFLILLGGAIFVLLIYDLRNIRREDLGVVSLVVILGSIFLMAGIGTLPPLNTKVTDRNEIGFRVGVIYEKLKEAQGGDGKFITILKDSKGKLEVFQSSKSLPDKFFATEDYEIVPFYPIFNVVPKENVGDGMQKGDAK